MSNIIEKTGKYSLIIQILTEILMIIVFYFTYNVNIFLLKELLFTELLVQMVEAFFYAWMIFNTSTVKNITIYRYLDWMITTPTMLITLIFYFIYIKTKEDEDNEDDDNEDDDNEDKSDGEDNSEDEEDDNEDEDEDKDKFTYLGLLYDNRYDLSIILALNWVMLLFGYLGEINMLSPVVSTFFGFIPFFIMFYLIYFKYAIYTETSKYIFWYFSFVWGLYGIAALMDYNSKNVMYNILDLFAKNFFGLFLSYQIFRELNQGT